MKTTESVAKRAEMAIVVASVITAIAGVISSFFLGLDLVIAIFITCVGLFAFIRIYQIMLSTEGWRRLKKPTILGMPRVLFVMYAISLLLVVSGVVVIVVSNPLIEATLVIRGLLGGGISILSALVTTLVVWYAGVGADLAD